MTYRNAVVIGLGISGEAAAGLLLSEGARVVVLDTQRTPDLERRAAPLLARGAEVCLAAEGVPRADFDVCILSPGVPTNSPWVVDLVARGVPVLSEFELGASRCECPIIAVTGSNGKSTMVKLCSDLLASRGFAVRPGGNYGIPLSSLVAESGTLDWVVAEVSSFQLETVDRFCPRIAVLMNVYPNHLDRHANFQEYLRAKARLFAHMGPRDTAIIHAPDVGRVRRMVSRITGTRNSGFRTVTFGADPEADYRYEKGGVRFDAGRQWVSVEGSRFDNATLGLTAAAAVAVLDACHVPVSILSSVARSFVPLPHRMTEVSTVRGVRFVNDSKATTLTAMAAGVGMTDGPVRLIAGGLLKEHQLASVNNVLARNVRGAYLIGKAAQKMYRAWGQVIPCTVSETLEVAVKDAWRDAQAGETVLLSPACASFDQFRNFEDRGDQFCRQVLALKEREGL